MILRMFDDGRMAEITINSAEEVPAAMDLVRVLIANGISAAKIIRPRTTLSSKCSEGPPPDLA